MYLRLFQSIVQPFLLVFLHLCQAPSSHLSAYMSVRPSSRRLSPSLSQVPQLVSFCICLWHHFHNLSLSAIISSTYVPTCLFQHLFQVTSSYPLLSFDHPHRADELTSDKKAYSYHNSFIPTCPFFFILTCLILSQIPSSLTITD